MKANRWRGLTAMVKDAVENGSIAVEKIQKETANRPFAVLEQLGPLAGPARAIHAVHDFSVSTTHSVIRMATRVIGKTVDAVLETVERD